MEIFFSSSKLLMKVLFYAFFQFTLVCHCFLQVTTTNIFIKYPDSLIIVSHHMKPWQFQKSTQGKLALDVTDLYEPFCSEESLLPSCKGEYLEWHNSLQPTGHRNNLLLTDCAWNLGQFLPSVPLPLSLPHSVQDEGHSFDLQAPGCCQHFGHSLERSPSDNYNFEVETFCQWFCLQTYSVCWESGQEYVHWHNLPLECVSNHHDQPQVLLLEES